jgi:alpha-aminoadipate/glutamate carrier protein LysW
LPAAVDFIHPVYNTLDVGAGYLGPAILATHRPTNSTEDGSVIRCPECSAEIDVDEDEVEEGEILSCPECESELEVSQIHPVHLNVISEDDDDDEDEDDEEDEKESEDGDKGDLIEDEEEEVEDEE